MDEGKGFIVCKNRVKYRTNVAISPKNRKDVGCLAWKICGFEIDASFTTNLVLSLNVPYISKLEIWRNRERERE